MKLVLDTNVWLDLVAFRDPGVEFLRERRFEFYADARCAEELERVLARLGFEGMDEFRGACVAFSCWKPAKLPACKDADDQKFLEVALACGAQYLVTKDRALLELDRRKLPFRIVNPSALAGILLAA